MFKASHIKKVAIAVIVVALSIGLAPAVPASANPQSLSTNVPTPVFPNNTIPITRVVYIWTALSNATQYQYQVYQGSFQILNKVTTNTVCVSGTCVVMPAVDLAAGTYSWRVRATINGVNQPFSPWVNFVVAGQDTGFNSPFTSDAAGWVEHKGNWVLESSNYLTTQGVAGYASTISYSSTYSTLSYEVRMKRAGCQGCANVIAIRGNPSLDSTGWWKTEYTFDYTNTGLFSVWKDNNGSYTALKYWTSTSAINKGGWNTLRVTAIGSSLKFYINDVLVWSGTDSAYASGRVGIGMYRSTASTGDKLWVDWAQLTTTVTSTADIGPEDTTGVESSSGDKNMAP